MKCCSLVSQIAGENEQHPDVALVERVRAGDVSAYDTLVRKYERQIFRIAQHITQNREDAEDVMQDAFLKAYEKLDQFQGNSKFYTWLVRIAVNESLMRLRKRRTGKMVSIDEDLETEEGTVPRDLADWAPDPEQNYTQAELAEILRKTIKGLAPGLSQSSSNCATWKDSPRRTRPKRLASAFPPSSRACCAPGCNCASASAATSERNRVKRRAPEVARAESVTCTEFLALLDDLIDDSIAAETRAEVEKHLHKCGHCEVIFNTTRKTIEIYRSHEIYDLPQRSPRPPPRRHHGPLQKRLLSPPADSKPAVAFPAICSQTSIRSHEGNPLPTTFPKKQRLSLQQVRAVRKIPGHSSPGASAMKSLRSPLAVLLCCTICAPVPLGYAQQKPEPRNQLAAKSAERTEYKSTQLQGDDRILHALNRFTFGPRPGDLEAVRSMGLDKWFDQQLHPASLDETNPQRPPRPVPCHAMDHGAAPLLSAQQRRHSPGYERQSPRPSKAAYCMPSTRTRSTAFRRRKAEQEQKNAPAAGEH